MTPPAAPPRLPRRRADWPERLAAHVAAHRATPFAWGTHDCALFAAGAVQAVTGAWPVPWQWGHARAALRQLRARGGLAVATSAVLPLLPTPALAQRGDVLLVQPPRQAPHRRAWLAVADAGGWWAPGPAGLVHGPLAQASHAWGVGHHA